MNCATPPSARSRRHAEARAVRPYTSSRGNVTTADRKDERSRAAPERRLRGGFGPPDPRLSGSVGHEIRGFPVEFYPSNEAPPAGPVRSPHLPVAEPVAIAMEAPSLSRGSAGSSSSRAVPNPVWRTRQRRAIGAPLRGERKPSSPNTLARRSAHPALSVPALGGALFRSFRALRARAASGDSGRGGGTTRGRHAAWAASTPRKVI